MKIIIVLLIILVSSFAQAEENLSWNKTSMNDSVQIKSFEFFENYVFAIAEKGMYISTDQGGSWSLSLSDTLQVLDFKHYNGVIYIVAYDWKNQQAKGVLSSFDDGLTWTEFILNHLYVTSFIKKGTSMYASIHNLIELNGRGILQSTDGGASWNQTWKIYNDVSYSKLKLINDIMYCNISMGDSNYIMFCNDDGYTWNDLIQDSFFVTNKIYDYQYNAEKDLLLNTEKGLYFKDYDNSAGTFVEIFRNNDAFQVKDLAINPNNQIFVCTGDRKFGIFFSNDNGNTYFESKLGLENIEVTSLGIDNEGYIYAGTNNNGIYKSNVSTTNITEINQPNIEIYPNPAQNAININNSSNSQIQIFNLLGIEVLNIKTDEQSLYQINCSNFENGLYYVLISSKEGRYIKKISILR